MSSSRRNPPSYPFGPRPTNVAYVPSRLSPYPAHLEPPARGPPQQAQSIHASHRPYAHQPTESTSSNVGLLAPESIIEAQNSSITLSSQAPTQDDRFTSKYAFHADPSRWGTDVAYDIAEPDDFLHNPDPRRDRKKDETGTIFTLRGIANIGFLVILGLGLLTLFAGYPIISHFETVELNKNGGYGLGGVNASGQIPVMTGFFVLVDPETPKDKTTYTSNTDKSSWELVFSDEFNTPNRTFYPGDDPYWEAIDLHYWSTGDQEYYDPSAVITKDGSLQITISQEETHGFPYKGGHLSSWNKFCFSGGYIEVNASLPSNPVWGGLWPAVWMMGNLGRAGYGATTDGMWPYSYDECDWGTLPNQTFNGQPEAALTGNPSGATFGGVLSYLPGQRLSRCTCKGDPNHPGPQRSDGTFYGRSAPELDIFEAASTHQGVGTVSQSAQYAPFDAQYEWFNGTGDVYIYNNTGRDTAINGYKGGVYQMAVSAVSTTDQTAYELTGGSFATYGIEYKAGSDGYVTWFNNGQPMWTMFPGAVGPDPIVNISQRLVPAEPMYIIMNLGKASSFNPQLSDDLSFPATMKIDYIRVYQDPNSKNIGCSPQDYPTEKYINQNIEAYMNPNLTTFSGNIYGSFNATLPKNSLVDQC